MNETSIHIKDMLFTHVNFPSGLIGTLLSCSCVSGTSWLEEDVCAGGIDKFGDG